VLRLFILLNLLLLNLFACKGGYDSCKQKITKVDYSDIGIRIKRQDELRKYLEDHKDFSALLFKRENFEFFVNIK